MSFTAGTRLGVYEIVSALGAGGMGEVYKARDTRLDRHVAIKVLAPALASDPAFRSRFETEARLIAGLSHPNICALHDVGLQDGISYLVLEHLEGQTLADRLAHGALPLPQALEIARQVADGLTAAHKRRVVHRDLKPGNIFLTKAGAKLLDFGLAKAAVSTTSPSDITAAPTAAVGLTKQGTILGTFQYMSPEQLEGHDADERSDIWGFGCVLYEMLTGTKAFEGRSQASLIAAILERHPPAASELQSLSPPSLDRLVMKCLAKDPEDRWQTARDLLDELRWIEAQSTGMRQTGSTIAARPAAAGRRSPWRAIGLVATGALTGAAVVWAFAAGRAVTDLPGRRITLSIVVPRENPFSGGAVPALSPDGRTLAYVAGADGKRSIWIRDLDSVTPRELAGTNDAQYPFWSADSRFLAFRSGATLKRVAAAGGSTQTIGDASNGFMGTWGVGDIILYSRFTSGLSRIAAVGGERVMLTTPDESAGEISHRYPWFLPDGRHFLYLSLNRDEDKSAVYVANLDAPRSGRKLFPAQSNVAYANGHILFVRNGTLMAQPFDVDSLNLSGAVFPVAEGVDSGGNTGMNLYTLSQTGVLAYASGVRDDLKLTWLDSSGRAVGSVGTPGYIREFGVSPDGDQVAVARRDSRTGLSDIWIHDAKGVTASRITFNSRDNRRPVWSPDGTRVAYSSVRTGAAEIFVRPARTSGAEAAVPAAMRGMIPEAWSTTGHLITALQSASSNWDVWVIPTASSATPLRLTSTNAPERYPRVSPDGRWVAYSALVDVESEVYVNAVKPNSERLQVTASGGQRPVWSADGRRLFFHANDTVMSVDVTAAGESLQFGQPRPLFALRLPSGGEFDVAPGDRFLAPLPAQQSDTVLTVVSNWLARD